NAPLDEVSERLLYERVETRRETAVGGRIGPERIQVGRPFLHAVGELVPALLHQAVEGEDVPAPRRVGGGDRFRRRLGPRLRLGGRRGWRRRRRSRDLRRRFGRRGDRRQGDRLRRRGRRSVGRRRRGLLALARRQLGGAAGELQLALRDAGETRRDRALPFLQVSARARVDGRSRSERRRRRGLRRGLAFAYERSLARGEIGRLLRELELAGAVGLLAGCFAVDDGRFARGQRLLPFGEARDPLLCGALELAFARGERRLPLVDALLLRSEPFERRAQMLLDVGAQPLGAALAPLRLLGSLRFLRGFRLLRSLGLLGSALPSQQEQEQE